MDETLTLTLKRPVQLGDAAPITEITLEEPTAGQLEQALKEPQATTANIVLVASVAKIPPGAVRMMVTSDFNKAVDFLSGFTREAETPSG